MNKNRPTSPHLQIYKWNISSLTSILHRFTGIFLYLAITAIAWYIVYYTYQVNIAESEESCHCPIKAILDKIFVVAAAGVVFALYYHFLNGIRHLFWDIGKGFEKKTAKITGIVVLFLAFALTVATIGTVIYLKFF